MSEFLSVAVVILNWNGRRYLEQFLPFLQQTTYPSLSIVVADNGSTDDSIPFLEQHYPGVHILRNRENEGYAKGYNTALAQVKADIFVLLNSDVEVTPGWITPIVKLFQHDNTIAAVQPKIMTWANRKVFEYAGGAGGFIDRYGYPFCRGRIFDYCEEDTGQYNDSIPVFWASGAALCIRSSAFFEMGGFDPYFFAHQEEIDLCWRLQLAGYKVYVCPESVVYHVGGGTLPKGNSLKVFLNFRNNLIMLYKNYYPLERLWKIPYRILLDVVSAYKNLFIGQTSYFRAVVKAHFAFAGWIFFHRKESVFPKKRTGKPASIFNGNIVWKHFIHGIKTFSDITHAKK